MAKSPANTVNVALTQAAEASQGVALVQQAQGLVITDKASHEACRDFLKGAKALKKKIENHYAAIKAPLNAARATVLDMEKRDLAPVLQAIAAADQIDTGYVREQRRIELEAAEAAREKAEQDERDRRQKEADKAEAAALKLEASSESLSEREQNLVSLLVAYVLRNGHGVMPTLSQWADAVERVGYKNTSASVNRLMQSEKVIAAINAQLKAVAIRRESEAKQAAPVLVDVAQKPSEIVDGGIRTYYGCKAITDVPALLRALADSYGQPASADMKADMDRFLLPALLTLMSARARGLKDLFPQIWTMCTLDKRDGTVGR